MRSTQDNRTYYQILNISPTATAEEIHKVCVQKAKKLHPDKNPDKDTTEEMKAFLIAREVLDNPVKRAEYDRLRQQPTTQTPIFKKPTPEEAEDLDFPADTFFYADKQIWMKYSNHRIQFMITVLAQTQIENLLQNYSLRNLAKPSKSSYNRFEIDAKDGIHFLSALLTVKKNFEFDFYIISRQLKKLIDGLYNDGHIDITQKKDYQTAIPAALTLSQRGNYARRHSDFDEAVALAYIYKGKEDSTKALYWLLKAFEYGPPANPPVDEVINLDEFLRKFNTIDDLSIFEKNKAALLIALAKNETILKLTVRDNFDSLYINSYLSNYLAATKNLKILDLSLTVYNKTSYSRLSTRNVDYIAKGMQQNTSIEELSLAGHPIGDEGVCLLLEALKKNPANKLKKLSLAETRIGTIGIQALINYMNLNTTLEEVEIQNNHLPEAFCNLVSRFGQRNKQINELRKLHHSEKNDDLNKKMESLTTPFCYKHTFFTNVDKGLNSTGTPCSEINSAWDKVFATICKPYAEVKLFGEEYSDISDDLNFVIALKHLRDLQFNPSFTFTGSVVYVTKYGTVCSNSLANNVAISILNSPRGCFLSPDSSVLKIKLKNLKTWPMGQLDEKFSAVIKSIKLVLQTMFAEGICHEGSAQFLSWLSEKDFAFETMQNAFYSTSVKYDQDFFQNASPQFCR